jgi:hypothetical protein
MNAKRINNISFRLFYAALIPTGDTNMTEAEAKYWDKEFTDEELDEQADWGDYYLLIRETLISLVDDVSAARSSANDLGSRIILGIQTRRSCD